MRNKNFMLEGFQSECEHGNHINIVTYRASVCMTCTCPCDEVQACSCQQMHTGESSHVYAHKHNS